MLKYDVWERVRLNLRDYYFCGKARISQHSGQQLVFCNSFPKSGTHLLAEILRQFDGVHYWNEIVAMQSLSGVMNDYRSIDCKVATAPRRGLVRCHLSSHEEIKALVRKRGAAHFFIYRDPRDVAVSHANWVLNEPKFYLYDYYRRNFTSFDECLMASITGISIGSELGSNLSHPSIGDNLLRWIGWLKDPECMCIKFEDLVGNRGGGDEETRLSIVRNMHSKLDLAVPSNIDDIFGSLSMDPMKSHTFRMGKQGVIGGWKDVFRTEHKEAFKFLAGELLVELGYEEDNVW